MTDGVVAEPNSEGLTAHRPSLKALTGIRFLAAAYVVVFHSRLSESLSRGGYALAANFFANGFLAVPLFFILSGFILAYTYEGQIEMPGGHRRFYEARFARIWPLYAVSLILMSLVEMRLPGLGVTTATLLMLQAWNPFDQAMAGAWNPVCWTLSCELLFYLSFPWAQLWLGRRSGRAQAWVLVAALVVCVATNSGSRTLWYAAEGAYRYIPLPIVHLPEFLVGVALGNFFLKQRTGLGNRSGLRSEGAITVAACLVAGGLLCRPASSRAGWVIPAFAALVYALAAERTGLSRLLASRWLVLGGGMSYAMYLTQIAVKMWVLLLFDRIGVGSVWLRLGTTMGVLLAVSYVLFAFVSEPLRRYGRALFARRERGQKSGVALAG